PRKRPWTARQPRQLTARLATCLKVFLMRKTLPVVSNTAPTTSLARGNREPNERVRLAIRTGWLGRWAKGVAFVASEHELQSRGTMSEPGVGAIPAARCASGPDQPG